MPRRHRILAVLTAALCVLAACSDDDEDTGDAEATTTTSAAAAAETTLVDPLECSALDDPVDASALEGVGCLESDGVVAIATTAACPDGEGTVVFISDRMGLEGGEWVEANEDWESLCP